MSMGMELYNGDKGKQFKMGESPSFGTLASARGMAKLAAAMADRGQASNSRTVQTVYRVPICPRGNLPYIRPYPINNTMSTLNNTKSTHHKSTLNLDLPNNRLLYKWLLQSLSDIVTSTL